MRFFATTVEFSTVYMRLLGGLAFRLDLTCLPFLVSSPVQRLVVMAPVDIGDGLVQPRVAEPERQPHRRIRVPRWPAVHHDLVGVAQCLRLTLAHRHASPRGLPAAPPGPRRGR